MKISIITVCYNAEKYIRTCIDSIVAQSYKDIEYIIIDGLSKDGTMDIVRSYGDKITKCVSEKDKGLYDAMNKGVKLATGDIIGILNADDFFADNGVLQRVADAFAQNPTDTLFADLVYVHEDNLDKVTRFFSPKNFVPTQMSQGLMPPHPTFYVKRECYEKFGYFDTQFRICADFDLILRFLLIHQCSYQYLPKTLVKMRTGGASTQGIKSTIKINQEMRDSCRKNGVKTSLFYIYTKYFSKIFQLIIKK